jgi:hypothetical protein
MLPEISIKTRTSFSSGVEAWLAPMPAKASNRNIKM